MSACFRSDSLREGLVGQQLANMGYRLAPIPGVDEANIEPLGSAQIGPPSPNSEEWSTVRLGLTLRSSHHRVSSAGDERLRRLTGESGWREHPGSLSSSLPESAKKRFRRSEIRRVETLGEPLIDWLEDRQPVG